MSAPARVAELPQGTGGKRTELLLQVVSQFETQLGLGETRASLLLAASGALATAYITAVQTAGGLWSQLGQTGKSFFVAASVALVLAIVFCSVAVLPSRAVTRFGASRFEAQGAPASVVHFGQIAAMDRDGFVGSYRGVSDERLVEDLLDSMHGKARKLRSKFTQLSCVVFCLVASVALGALSLLTLVGSAAPACDLV